MNKDLDSYKADGVDAKGYVCDVTDEAAVNAMVKLIQKNVVFYPEYGHEGIKGSENIIFELLSNL